MAVTKAWRKPRTWEGKESNGSLADKIGEWDSTNEYGSKSTYDPASSNKYDLTFEWSELIAGTMPGIASAAGQMFVGSGTNSLTTLTIGTGMIRVVSGSVAVLPDSSLDTQYYTTSSANDLVVGNSSGSPSSLSAPSTTSASDLYVLQSTGAGQAPQWVKWT